MNRFFAAIGSLLLVLIASTAQAHEVRPAHLKLKQLDQHQWQATFRQPLQGGKFLNLSVISNCQQTETDRVTDAQATQVHYDFACGEQGLQQVTIQGLERTLVDTLVSIQRHSSNDEATKLENAIISPKNPQLQLSKATGLLPSYLMLGLEHLWFGIDHVIFIVLLVYLVSGWVSMFQVVTSFTIAHSITLGVSALQLVTIPQAPVEALIALSIILLALECLSTKKSSIQRFPWLLSFGFGLLHGLGFAGALAEIGLPEGSQFLALLLFNLGIEFAQLSIVITLLLISFLAQRLLANRVLAWQFIWRTVPLYLMGGTASFWFLQRSFAVFFN